MSQGDGKGGSSASGAAGGVGLSQGNFGPKYEAHVAQLQVCVRGAVQPCDAWRAAALLSAWLRASPCLLGATAGSAGRRPEEAGGHAERDRWAQVLRLTPATPLLATPLLARSWCRSQAVPLTVPRYKNEQLTAELGDVIEQSSREGGVQGALQVHARPPARRHLRPALHRPALCRPAH
jgi:hypothetical protein